LQVAGAPSWDVKFLRRFLEGDPSVQLVSFFILRTQRDLATSYTERELSLIQFPYERLFEEDLWTFDVVIFQNFDAENYFDPYQSGTLLGNVREYVENGGAFVMIGGDRSFGLGHYGATPLADLLPRRAVAIGRAADTASFLPMLTEEGERHPITRLVAEAGENAEWWKRLHPLDGTNVVLRAKPDAAVLLAHPDRKDADGRPLPILAVQEVGAGRSMALTVDASVAVVAVGSGPGPRQPGVPPVLEERGPVAHARHHGLPGVGRHAAGETTRSGRTCGSSCAPATRGSGRSLAPPCGSPWTTRAGCPSSRAARPPTATSCCPPRRSTWAPTACAPR
jgi:uncharacterized membrane protein